MRILKVLLYPLSKLYDLITFIRNKLYDNEIFKSFNFENPIVICIGNLNVGGSGKTPHIEYLINILKDDFKIAVLSRGYKRKSKGFVIADKYSTVDDIGDEPLQLYKKNKNITVAVDANRVRGIKYLKKAFEKLDIVLLDDAFQHRAIRANLNILLTDYSKNYKKDYLMPLGLLRENAKGADRADIIIVSKCPIDISKKEKLDISKELNIKRDQRIYFSSIIYSEFIYNRLSNKKIESLKNQEITLVTGIANPNPLEEFLKEKKINFMHLNYRDHHNFTKRDLEVMREKQNTILTTEKDYMRLLELPIQEMDIWYIPIKVNLSENDQNNFNREVFKYINYIN
ncbi:tetraacyldisaccharide 4'-kinase [Ichthyobacterium seriolicida]|uniref:Tetraacyldisaccharide 4'-kinase n=1 Tax=Ichthyobacterium seriolicida TaxID=242600 RepID=A0A1J1E587_9FLAO|nr:tetraacyldisaccharide 4'-kinase [Ichthyobacterium seriolicida]BAV95220.1 tetraacyldisaccharide 4'-kinase [Ichthyobacterium seriolicida]